MFNKLRNKIIIITMVATTAVLILAGCVIMLFSSTMRPEPKPRPEPMMIFDRELNDYIRSDREEGNIRLLATLIAVGVGIEVAVFLVSYVLSKKIIEPVESAYEKQKLFIANASHELKTPLAVIQANVEALDVDKENEKWKNNIENEITHANKLVLDLLQLAKMDAGNIGKNAPEKFNFSEEISKRVEMFSPKFGGKINLKSSVKKEFFLPKQDILQVLDILLDNATKYGEKKISVVLNENSVAVLNDGAKIPKKDLEKVFDRFYQTDKTKEGSGLGLAIAKAICKQNGWKISATSEKGLTKFLVIFK